MLGRPSFTMPLPSVMVPCDTSPARRDVPSPSGGRDVEGEHARAESNSSAHDVWAAAVRGIPPAPTDGGEMSTPERQQDPGEHGYGSAGQDPEDVEQPDRAPPREEPEEKDAEDARDEDDEPIPSGPA